MRTPKMCKSLARSRLEPASCRLASLSSPVEGSRARRPMRVWIPSAALRDPPSPATARPAAGSPTVRKYRSGGAIERQLLQLRRRYRGLQCAQIRGRLADERIVQLQQRAVRWSRLTPNIQCSRL